MKHLQNVTDKIICQVKKNTDLKENLMVSVGLWLTKNNSKITERDIKVFSPIIGISVTELKSILKGMDIPIVTQEEKERSFNIWDNEMSPEQLRKEKKKEYGRNYYHKNRSKILSRRKELRALKKAGK